MIRITKLCVTMVPVLVLVVLIFITRGTVSLVLILIWFWFWYQSKSPDCLLPWCWSSQFLGFRSTSSTSSLTLGLTENWGKIYQVHISEMPLRTFISRFTLSDVAMRYCLQIDLWKSQSTFIPNMSGAYLLEPTFLQCPPLSQTPSSMVSSTR